MILLLLLPLILGFGLALKFTEDAASNAFAMGLQAVAWIMNIVLYPINYLISQFIPDFDSLGDRVAALFDTIGTYIGYILNATLLPQPALLLIISYFVFAFTVTFGAYTLKLALKWKAAT